MALAGKHSQFETEHNTADRMKIGGVFVAEISTTLFLTPQFALTHPCAHGPPLASALFLTFEYHACFTFLVNSHAEFRLFALAFLAPSVEYDQNFLECLSMRLITDRNPLTAMHVPNFIKNHQREKKEDGGVKNGTAKNGGNVVKAVGEPVILNVYDMVGEGGCGGKEL